MPKVSVIMPVYNAEKYLREAINSILNQTFTDFELIILNDDSKDATVDIIRSFGDPRIRYVKNEHNMGVAMTLNRGLDLARGTYIARMDADDISMPERLEKQVTYMDAHPEVGLCGSNIMIFSESGDVRIHQYAEKDAQIRADMLFNSAFAHPSVMVRSSALGSMRYDYNFEKAEDYELWYRLLKAAEGHNIQESFLRYRHHGNQVTQTMKPQQRTAVLKMHRKILDDLDVILSEAEYEAFIKICDGQRNFTQQQYDAFASGGKKLICAYGKKKKELQMIYSLLNLAIRSVSAKLQTTFFSTSEIVWNLYRVIRRRHR